MHSEARAFRWIFYHSSIEGLLSTYKLFMIFNYLMNRKYSREIKEAEDEFHKMILGKIKNEQIRHLDKNGGILFEGEMMGVIDEVFDP